jgi:hypothetical protein
MSPPGSSTGQASSAGAMASASTGIVAAAITVVTAACCTSPVLAPVLLSVLGASGLVWTAGLKPYGWLILGGAFVFLALGFRMVYRPKESCAVESIPRRQRVLERIAKVSLWFGAASWLAGVILKLVLPS